MNLAACAREIFESSEVDKKRQLLNFVFMNKEAKLLALLEKGVGKEIERMTDEKQKLIDSNQKELQKSKDKKSLF